MARYFPEPVPYTDELPYIREWLGREFSNILAAFEEVELIQLTKDHVEPVPRDGMIKFADGTNWDPGDGQGFYGYRNGGWVKLDLGGTSTAQLTRLRLSATDDANLSSTLHALQIGATSGPNVIFDTNEIEARNNGASAELNLNADGSKVILHSADAAGANSILDIRGGRILFPATQQASSDANTLDDYEEGTWTPTFLFSGGATGITYTIQAGWYLKIGQFVFYQGRIQLSNKGSSTGNARIGSLPFTVGNLSQHYPPGSVGYGQNWTLTGALGTYAEANNTYVNLMQSAAGGFSYINETHTTNTSDIIFAGCYRASA